MIENEICIVVRNGHDMTINNKNNFAKKCARSCAMKYSLDTAHNIHKIVFGMTQ